MQILMNATRKSIQPDVPRCVRTLQVATSVPATKDFDCPSSTTNRAKVCNAIIHGILKFSLKMCTDLNEIYTLRLEIYGQVGI